MDEKPPHSEQQPSFEDWDLLPDVSAVDLTRTRSALRTDVDFEVTDTRSAVMHVCHLLDSDAIDKAIRRYIKLRGAEFKKLVETTDVHESGIRFYIRGLLVLKGANLAKMTAAIDEARKRFDEPPDDSWPLGGDDTDDEDEWERPASGGQGTVA